MIPINKKVMPKYRTTARQIMKTKTIKAIQIRTLKPATKQRRLLKDRPGLNDSNRKNIRPKANTRKENTLKVTLN